MWKKLLQKLGRQKSPGQVEKGQSSGVIPAADLISEPTTTVHWTLDTSLSGSALREHKMSGSQIPIAVKSQNPSTFIPPIGFSSSNSKYHAGRDIGSRNVSQQGDGFNIALGDSSQVHFHDGPIHNEEQEHETLLRRIRDKISGYIVPEAQLSRETHGKVSVCYTDTRTGLLEDILLWVEADKTDNGVSTAVQDHTLCVEGAPGSGKSTILNTMIVNLLEQAQIRCHDLLTAHYSIRRGLKSTTDADRVLTTLVYQLAHHSIDVARGTIKLLQSIPHTGVLSPDAQRRLFLEALKASGRKALVIIDALDESSEPALLATALSRIIWSPPRNLRLLLATRNEHDVLASLGVDLTPIIRSIPTDESIQEVGQYIGSRLREGVNMMFSGSPTWAGWPSPSQIKSLSARAAGLYIWASTAVDFILSRLKKRGVTNRDRLIEDVGRLGMAGVDALYTFILENQLEDDDAGNEPNGNMTRTRMQGILGFIIAAEHPLPLDDIINFLGYEDFDARHFVGLARSILVPGMGRITGSTHPQMHKTFVDFLTSSRAGKFQIDIRDHHRLASQRCFMIMTAQLRFNIFDLESSFSQERDDYSESDDSSMGDESEDCFASISSSLVYASTCWSYHLENAGLEAFPLDLSCIRALYEDNFLFWLEIVGQMKKADEAGGWMSKLGDRLEHQISTIGTGAVSLVGFARDAAALTKKFRFCIETNIPHIYISLLAFTPEKSIVASHYRNKITNPVISHPSQIPPSWDSWDTDPRMTNHGQVWSVSFSPCGRRLAVGYLGGAIRVWDVESGNCILGPLEGHEDNINSVCFSPNGLLLASGSGDMTIRIWESKAGRCILGPLTGHTHRVTLLAFSPDGSSIASASRDHTIRVWNSDTGDCVLGPLEGHNDVVRSVEFSVDASYIASSSDDRTIRLWDAQSGKCVLSPDSGHEGAVFSISFSPDGSQRLVSGSSDNTLRMWNTRTGQLLHGPFIGHTGWVYDVCFSPDSRYIASGSLDRTVRIWDAETDVCVIGPIRGAAGAIESIAFSPDGRHLAAGSEDGTVRLWDFEAMLRTQGLDGPVETRRCGDLTGQEIVAENNWIFGPKDEMLFWAPEPYISAIWRPSTTKILGRSAEIRVDLSKLVTGKEWRQCF